MFKGNCSGVQSVYFTQYSCHYCSTSKGILCFSQHLHQPTLAPLLKYRLTFIWRAIYFGVSKQTFLHYLKKKFRQPCNNAAPWRYNTMYTNDSRYRECTASININATQCLHFTPSTRMYVGEHIWGYGSTCISIQSNLALRSNAQDFFGEACAQASRYTDHFL